MKHRNWLTTCALVSVLAIVGAACGEESSVPPGGGTPTDGGEMQTVKIGFIGALSGDYKLLVVSGFNAAQLAFDQANAAGDLPVHVELVDFDSQGSGDIAAPLVDQITGDDAFVGVIGPAFSGESAAVGDKLDQAGIPSVTQSATDDALAQNGWTHWFRALGNNSDMGAPAADYIAKVVGAATACAASDGTPYGLGLKEVAVDQFGTDGVEVVLNEDVEPAGKDYSALVTKIDDAGCEALFYGGYSPEAGLIRAQMNAAGLESVPMVGGDGIKDDTFISTAGKEGEGTISSCTCADLSTSTDEDDQQFITDYTAEFGEAPQIYGPEGWDAAQMFIAAFRAGNTDRESITTFIRDMAAFHGLTKDYTWDADGQLAAEARILFFYEVQDGAWTVIGPSSEVVPA
ncbi:MAG TPA: branched-chain amino acid ABC transporter substrate-binding protein [Actinomycetota bacterium]|jgi:branched-chain amino acid transport system substrate-binding protein|nr:branched-chain amino acid ABC transporter substrate-binding protein [Actinomycetota bacterium]